MAAACGGRDRRRWAGQIRVWRTGVGETPLTEPPPSAGCRPPRSIQSALLAPKTHSSPAPLSTQPLQSSAAAAPFIAPSLRSSAVSAQFASPTVSARVGLRTSSRTHGRRCASVRASSLLGHLLKAPPGKEPGSGGSPPRLARPAGRACILEFGCRDPFSMASPKALENIGKALHSQYQRWQPKARYKLQLDLTVEEVKSVVFSEINGGFVKSRARYGRKEKHLKIRTWSQMPIHILKNIGKESGRTVVISQDSNHTFSK